MFPCGNGLNDTLRWCCWLALVLLNCPTYAQVPPRPVPPVTPSEQSEWTHRLRALETRVDAISEIQRQPQTQPNPTPTTEPTTGNNRASDFSGNFTNTQRFDIGSDLYAPPAFEGGIVIIGENAALKIGGYVKADFIHDFDPIDNTDSFETPTIPVGAPERTNSRFHARQSRLSFDTRWKAGDEVVRCFVEGDFFSQGNAFRLRHAYGEVGQLLVGQTWTTFTDVAAAPQTLDFEGSVSAVNRRQALARWTTPVVNDRLLLALAVEDTQFIVSDPLNQGTPRSPYPDLVGHLRYEEAWAQFQVAYVRRIGGFQPTDEAVFTDSGWGWNITGVLLLHSTTKFYSQIVFGSGIGSYRGLPDGALTVNQGEGIGMFGWMVGLTHEWNDSLSSNFTYAENQLDNASFQPGDEVHRTTYLAANLIWTPLPRLDVGVEYLYGTRQNVDRNSASAHRLQSAVIFRLP